MKKNFVEELKWRGMIHDIMPGTEELLSKEVVSGYIGFDPTSDSLGVTIAKASPPSFLRISSVPVTMLPHWSEPPSCSLTFLFFQSQSWIVSLRTSLSEFSVDGHTIAQHVLLLSYAV